MNGESPLNSLDHKQGAAIALASKIANDVEKPITKASLPELLADIDALRRKVEAFQPTA